MQPRYNEDLFSFVTHHRIRSHECDRQGVMHNARYIEMLEVARIEFCRDVLKVPIDQWTFAQHHKFYFVRNELNYFHPARFDDELTIFTRVSKVGRTSVTLEQIVNRDRDNRRILEAEAVMVSVDEVTDNPKEIEPGLRERIIAAGAAQQ
jgi:acyl-CoA thioester hydrolase